jgi:threonine aldolase
MSDEDRDLQASCTRQLSGHRQTTPAQTLKTLAEHPAASEPPDTYGAGGAATLVEQRTAQLLGKPAAMFFIKGMIAQMTLLRTIADRAGTRNIVVHPMSHIELDEEGALWRMHNLHPLRLGKYAPFTLAQLEAVMDPVAAIVVELPLRRSGYLLPPLEELRAVSAWARHRGIHLHFDGARLWESAAGYGIGLDELASLADSVYVSFYKGLGGLGGAAVAGEEAFIRSLAAWKTRHGGNLYRVFPYAISGMAGLDAQLPRMPVYVERARALAQALSAEPRLAITPRVPNANAFHLLVPGSVEELTSRNREFARARGIWMFNQFYESPVDGRSIGEVVIGDSSDGYAVDEAAAWIRDFLDLA